MTSSKERRLLAVMFTDVVGYTALMQRDEEAARIVRRRHRQVLETAVSAHGGDLLQYLGDGSLTMFPSVVEAVRAAVEVQHGLRQEPVVPLRIGIHQGDISYDTQGAYGDSMNVASRIQSLGTAGSILLSAKAHDEIKNQPDMSTTSLGEFELKNVEESLEVYAIVSDVLAVPTRSDVLTKIRGEAAVASNITIRLNTALAGRYRIEREVGEGGMATVYLADDIKHERKVALKVLKPELAAVVGAERFLAEIKTTANLQHPHILPLFDSGEADGFVFYVMPYVEGESLRERLDREHQLPVDEAVRIASDVAEALGYAHGRGVIHRDIKPANILIQAGRPVIADFGIALAVSAGGAARLTETGLSVGTPHYMSPEQATGDQTVGPATDTYALGCVLYEMLVGEPPYTGSTAQAILGRIIAAEPESIAAQRRSVPPNVDEAILRALEKLPADRFENTAAFAAALSDAAFRHLPHGAPVAASASWAWRPLALGMTAVAVISLGFVVSARSRSDPALDLGSQVLRVEVLFPEGDAFSASQDELLSNGGRPSRTALAFSPDGSTLVWTAQREGVTQLFSRPLDREPAPIEGTEGGVAPFYSPDGLWIGFWADGAIRRVPSEGGLANQITQTANNSFFGADWGSDGLVVYATSEGLWTVLADGTAPPKLRLPLVAVEATSLHSPRFLPGGDAVTYTEVYSREFGQQRIARFSLVSGTSTTLIENAADARYLSTGYLTFVRSGTLTAIEFDPRTVETGASRAVVPDVMQALNGTLGSVVSGAGQYAVSAAGHLAYLTGGLTPDRITELAWFDRAGNVTKVPLPTQRAFGSVRLAPDEQTAVATSGGGNTEVSIVDLSRLSSRALEPMEGRKLTPTWSPDGERIAFSVIGGDSEGIYLTPADFSTPPQLLTEETGRLAFWSEDSGELFFIAKGYEYSLRAVSTSDGRTRSVMPGPIMHPALSPDGRWLAYTVPAGDRGGDVYVSPFPSLDGEDQVSTNGGWSPLWTRGGTELIYLTGEVMGVGTVFMSVAVQATQDSALHFSIPDSLFAAEVIVSRPRTGHSVTRDGERMLVVLRSPPAPPHVADIKVVMNWFTELRERMGGN